MKRVDFLFVLSAALLCIAACQRDCIPESIDSNYTLFESFAPSKGELNSSFFVSEEDIQSYIRYKALALKKDIVVTDITAIKDADDNVLSYIINYDDGWDLLAADKRATLPLGWCATGYLNLEKENNPLLSWIGCLAEDVYVVRTTNESNAKNPDLVEFNLNFWKSITADSSLFEELLDGIFSKGQTRDSLEIPYPGHYELVGSSTISVPYDSVPHLTETWWNQNGYGCDNYVPFRSDTSYLKVPAGCTNIAGAQMLYYLHEHINAPTEAPTSAYCIGNISSYIWGQDDFADTAWAQMTPYGGDVAGMLIAFVAKSTYTQFHNHGSSSYIRELHNVTYPFLGISSTHSLSYDDDIVKSSLLNAMPVIVTAYPSLLSIYGHTFIIDGYYRKRTQITSSYMWVWDDYNPQLDYPDVPDQIVISYTSPIIISYEMNWGWGYYYYHTYYHFAPSGEWMPVDKDYTSRRHMLYGFEAVE